MIRFICRRVSLRTSAHHIPARLTLACLPLLAILLVSGCGTNSGVTISANMFNFGSVPVNTRIKRLIVTIANPTKAPVSLNPVLSGTMQGALSRSGSCETSLPASSSCSLVFTFAPSTAGAQAGKLALNLSGMNLPANQTIELSGTAVVLNPGDSLVETTNNPLVARYSYHPAAPGSVWVDFGTTTDYGLKTSLRATPATGGTVSLFVAGMRANTMYHLRASVLLADGSVMSDADHTFTTSSFPASILPNLAVTSNGTPQPGIELVDAAVGTTPNFLQAYATDLAGNIIWGYNYPDRGADTIAQPIKLLPNGNFLAVISYPSQVLAQGVPSGELVDLREINLAGDPVRDISGDQINQRLAAAGFNLTIYDLHHDVIVLPNQHWIVLANTIRNIPGSGNVVGDVVIDLDTHLNPVWVWNEFDHLDVNRRPVSFPDWTHSNSLLYSPDDGNLLVSIRHQSWIVKVDYRDGIGTGNVLWRLGQGGDFKLTNGTDPIDWFAGQHQPAFFGLATSGVFSLSLMDNGFNRMVSPGTYCGSAAFPCFTSVPILLIDENARTASFVFQQKIPESQYSFWGGGSTWLANGNLEYDLCSQNTSNSEVDEVKTSGDSVQPVWRMKSTGTNLYRANRIPSLYPGVQW